MWSFRVTIVAVKKQQMIYRCIFVQQILYEGFVMISTVQTCIDLYVIARKFCLILTKFGISRQI